MWVRYATGGPSPAYCGHASNQDEETAATALARRLEAARGSWTTRKASMAEDMPISTSNPPSIKRSGCSSMARSRCAIDLCPTNGSGVMKANAERLATTGIFMPPRESDIGMAIDIVRPRPRPRSPCGECDGRTDAFLRPLVEGGVVGLVSPSCWNSPLQALTLMESRALSRSLPEPPRVGTGSGSGEERPRTMLQRRSTDSSGIRLGGFGSLPVMLHRRGTPCSSCPSSCCRASKYAEWR